MLATQVRRLGATLRSVQASPGSASSRSLTKLAGSDRATALSSLSPAWLDLTAAKPDQLSGSALTGASAGRDAINRTFVFNDFKSAFGFMASAALHAEQVRLHEGVRTRHY